MTDPVLRLVVYGTPGTAGSKSAFPIVRDGKFVRTVIAEKDKQHVKRNWRASIVDAARLQIAVHTNTPDCVHLLDPFPLDEPLTASLVFTVKKPQAAPKLARSWPTARPDLLKYARAFEDALTAAGVLKDDARIVRYRDLAKVYPREDPDALDAPGAVFTLWRTAQLVDWQRTAVITGEPDVPTLFSPLNPPGVADPVVAPGPGGA